MKKLAALAFADHGATHIMKKLAALCILSMLAFGIIGSAVLSCHETANNPTTDHYAEQPEPPKFAAITSPGQVGPFVPPPSWSQLSWYVDPANTSGCASDNNRTCSSVSCTSGDGPCKSFGSITSRWGTPSPIIGFGTGQGTVIHAMSGEPNVYADQIIWSPSCVSNTANTAYSSITIVGTPTVVSTGAISAGTNLSHSGNTLTNANFSALAPDAASISAGTAVRDTTTSPVSFMWLEANTSGTTWNLTPPLEAYDQFTLFNGAPSWANQNNPITIGATDTVIIETLPLVNVSAMVPASILTAQSACVWIDQVTLGSANAITLGGGVLVSDSKVYAEVSAIPGPQALPYTSDGSGYKYQTVFYDDDILSMNNANSYSDNLGHEISSDRATGSVLLNGGAVGIDPFVAGSPVATFYANSLGSVEMQQDFVIGKQIYIGYITVGRGGASGLANFTDGITQSVIFTGNFSFHPDDNIIENGLIWGTGNIRVQDNAQITYTQAPSLVFLGSGSITCNGSTTANSSFQAGGAGGSVTQYGGIPITVTNLAATAGDAGFGNNAQCVGGARIRQTGGSE
jgi:hypothetical protein